MSSPEIEIEAIRTILGTTGAALPTDAATETTLAAVLAKIIAAPSTAALQTLLNALVTTPTITTAITASDVTDLSALTTKGVIVGGDGTVIVRSTGNAAVSVTINALAGQYIPVQCSRIMAASTATGLVGLS